MPDQPLKNFAGELKRRNVFRVAIAYLAASWVFIEVAATILPRLPEVFSNPESSIRTIIILVAIGFFPTLIFSWFFELTPGGFVRDSEIDHDVTRSAHAGRKFDFAIIGLLSVALIYFVSTHDWSERDLADASGFPEKSVAVLPFVNMSGNVDNEYFSDGLTETLMHALAQLPDLKVPARTSSFFYQGQDVDIRTIARDLGVSKVLEGSVQRDGNKVRIVAQLIEANTGYHLWSETYDREMDDIFAVQDEIATNVARAMEVTFTGDTESKKIEAVGTNNVAAYEHYLQALSDRRPGSVDGLQRAENQFKLALAADPEFRDAKIDLASTYILQSSTGLRSFDEISRDVLSAVSQIIESHPDDKDAQAIRAYTLGVSALNADDSDAFESNLAELSLLVAEVPHAMQVRRWFAELLLEARHTEDAIPHFLEIARLDPLNYGLYMSLGQAHRFTEDWESARTFFNRSIELNPEFAGAYYELAIVNRLTGDAVGYVANLATAAEVDPLEQSFNRELARFLYDLDLPQFAEPYWRKLEVVAPNAVQKLFLQLWRVNSKGQNDESIRIARRIIEAEGTENRTWTWPLAAFTLLLMSNKEDIGHEAVEFLLRYEPLLLDTSAEVVPQRTLAAQETVISELRNLIPKEHLIKLYAVIDRRLAAAGREPSIFFEFNKYAILGDIDSAVPVVIEFLSRPLLSIPFFDNVISQPAVADVLKDPRVQPLYDEMVARKSRYREEILAYMTNRNQP
jgi:TolB-like protein/tetratricopeptide (TPR) repeat protein